MQAPDLNEIALDDITLRYGRFGDPRGSKLLFLHGLGLDLRVWQTVLPRLPQTLDIITLDLRGHGGSSAPPAPYAMGALIRDIEPLMQQLDLRDAVLVGHGLGGLVAQGLAVKRLDLVRGLVLTGTAAKLGMPPHWQAHIHKVQTRGLAAMAGNICAPWTNPRAKDPDWLDLWHARVQQQPQQGYLGCVAALSGTDFYTPTSSLRLPVLGLIGSEDRVTPPDLQRETVDLVPGSRAQLIRRAGHLAWLDQPDAFATHLTQFLTDIGQS